MLRGAERVWPTRNEAQPNGEGVASGSATKIFLFFFLTRLFILINCLCKTKMTLFFLVISFYNLF